MSIAIEARRRSRAAAPGSSEASARGCTDGSSGRPRRARRSRAQPPRADRTSRTTWITASAQWSSECSRTTRRRNSAPIVRARLLRRRDDRGERRRRARRDRAAARASCERQVGEERRQRRIRRHDRPRAGGGLVDGLVEGRAGARLGRADDDVGGARAAPAPRRAGSGGSTEHTVVGAAARSHQLGAVRDLVRRQRRPADLERHVAVEAARTRRAACRGPSTAPSGRRQAA